MLRVRSLGSSARYRNLISGSIPYHDGIAGISVLIPYPYDATERCITGRISTGSTDEFGDRNCFHLNVEGELLQADSSVFQTSTVALALSSSYRLVSGSCMSVPHIRFKRSTGVWVESNTLYVPPNTSASLRVIDHLVVRSASKPLQRYECEYYEFFIHSDIGISEVGTRSKTRSSTNGGITWTNWVENTQFLDTVRFDLTGVPAFSRIVSGVWSSWSTITTAVSPCTLSLPSGGMLTKEQAEACDYWLAAATPPLSQDVWGDLSSVAIQDAQALSINTGMYLYELATMGKTLKSTIALLKGKWSYKTLASLYLGTRYGAQLTMADTLAIIDAAKREMQEVSKSYNWVRSTATDTMVGARGRFSGFVGSVTYHYKVYYKPYDHWFAKSLKSLMDVDLAPTLGNVWDLIPFSFVVDWFVDIGSLLEKIDMRTYVSTLSVLGTLSSTKRSVSGLPGHAFPFSGGDGRTLVGSWTCTSYQRTRSKTLTLPRYFLEFPQEFHNYAEATAIIAQKL